MIRRDRQIIELLLQQNISGGLSTFIRFFYRVTIVQLLLSLAVFRLQARFLCPIAFGELILPCLSSLVHSV